MIVQRNQYGNPAVTIELVDPEGPQEIAEGEIGRGLTSREMVKVLEAVQERCERELESLEDSIWEASNALAADAMREIEEERGSRARGRSEAELVDELIASGKFAQTGDEAPGPEFSPADLAAWYGSASSAIAALPTAAPACWGANLCLAEGECVPARAAESLLAGGSLDLFICMRANAEYPRRYPIEAIAEHSGDPLWLSLLAGRYADVDGGAYVADVDPAELEPEELATLARTRGDLFPAPGPTGQQEVSVETPLGTLAARYQGDPGVYDGILVELRKPDGTVGNVSLTEVVPEFDAGGASRLHTIAFDGNDEMEVYPCDAAGREMSYPQETSSLDDLEARCRLLEGRADAAPGRGPSRER